MLFECVLNWRVVFNTEFTESAPTGSGQAPNAERRETAERISTYLEGATSGGWDGRNEHQGNC